MEVKFECQKSNLTVAGGNKSWLTAGMADRDIARAENK